jgi:glycosyltransferase involved in cell wall biosynthesis
MKELLVFGENLAYKFGGAERSTYLLVRQLESRDGFRVRTASCTWKYLEGLMERYPYEGLDEIPCYHHRRLPYLRYVVNHARIADYFSKVSASVLLANNKAGAIAVNHFEGPSFLFIHDESNLNVRRDYRCDVWSRTRDLGQNVVDFPSFAAFAHMNRAAMRRATAVANSRYMASRARKAFGIEPIVVYPQIDVQGLSLIEMPPLEERPYILMVGESSLKGGDVFRETARVMPGKEFMLVGHSFGEPRRVGNLTERGFVPDPLEVYRRAQLVLMPSQCEEGFGMVSAEAQALGIPSIVSDRGGLPETVPFDDCVVPAYADPGAWARSIEKVLSDYDRFSGAARDHVRQLDMRLQADILIAEIERVTP